MQKRGKKALSTIVITLIIILVSLVAIAIIWVAVKNLISKGSEGITMGQFTMEASVEVIGINETRNNVSLIITRNPGQGDFTGIAFVFENITGKEKVEKHFTLYELESKGFELHLYELNVSNLTILSIYPLFKTSSSEFTLGSKTDEYIFTGIEKFLFKPGGGGICGNNIIEQQVGEACDGTDWGGITNCVSLGLGYISGPLTCEPPGDMRECHWDESQCVSPTPQCSDGADNDGNGCIDFSGGDTGCSSAADTTESGGASCFDTTPPVRSNGLPTGTLAAGTTQTNVSLITNENARCKYSITAGVAYASMTNTFVGTNLSHSIIISGLTDGSAYNYYVRCNDTAGNVNTNDFTISFSVGTGGSTSQIMTLSVATNNDDAMFYNDPSWTYNSDGNGAGTSWLGGWNFYREWGYARFQLTSSIASGSTITGANISFISNGENSLDSGEGLYVFVTDSGNAVQAVSAGERPSFDSGTTTLYPSTYTSGVRWPGSGTLSWPTDGVKATSSNLASLIQHLVSTYGGISSGQYIAVWIASTGYSSDVNDEIGWYNLEHATQSPPSLTIAWTGVPPAQCSDGADNDVNGCSDYPNDPGCSSSSDTTEAGGTCPDTTPPVRSNGLPTGTLPAGTTQTNMSLITNEAATCRYSASAGTPYASMTNTFTGTALSHSTIKTGLTNGSFYTYYVRCNDTVGNVNTNDSQISFNVASGGGGGDLIPLSRIASWNGNVGVPGGIPTGWANCVTTQCNTLFGGSVTSATISAAITSAPANTVVRIPAGTYTLSSTVEIARDNVILRGQGMGVTTLTAGAFTAIRTQQYGTIAGGTLASGYTKGSNSVVVSGNLPSVGNLIEMYQDDDPSLVWTRAGVNDYSIRHTAYVTAVNGNTVTFTPAMSYSFSASFNPSYSIGPSVEVWVGIENLTIQHGTSEPGESIYFYQDYASWVKNVEVRNYGDTGIRVSSAVNCEIRGCMIHDTNTYNDGYGVYLMSDYGSIGTDTACLVEDNIMYHSRDGVLFKGSTFNVVGYNYIGDTSPPFGWYMTEAINTNHGAHGVMNLIEGNIGTHLQNDGYHGSTSHTTIFRNWFHGTCGSYCLYPTGNRKTIDLCRFSWYENVYGNVLGDTSWTAAEYEMTGNSWDYTHPVIYRFGYPNMGNNYYNPANPPSNPDDGGYDPNVKATLLRHGNYDYLNNAVVWDPANSNHNLPASMYLSGRPSWWCQETPWPPIGYDVSGLHNAIPAQRRYLGQACTP